MMVSLEESQPLIMGRNSEPAAFLDLSSIGLPEGAQKVLSSKLCDLLKDKINLPSERVYLNFQDVERGNWGWNSRTFG